jgi:hypothetical protein
MSISLSGSLVITGSILSTQGIVGYATTGSNSFVGSQQITGSLTVSCAIIAQTINVQQVTSSIVYSCGDNIFGTALNNSQTFTGSMFITGSNIVANVGNACFINTITACNAFLQVPSTAAVIDILRLNNPAVVNSGTRLKFENGYGDLAAIRVIHRDNGSLADDGQIEFQVGSNAVLDTKMTILNTGQIGMGTLTPSAELQINKNCDAVIAISNCVGVTSGNRGSLAFYNCATSTVALIRAGAVTDNVGTELQFHIRPSGGSLTQAMTLNASGNVGIGTLDPIDRLMICGEDSGLYISNSSRSKLNLHTCGCGGWQIETNNTGGNQPGGALGITEVGAGSRFHIAKGGVSCFQNTVCAPAFVGGTVDGSIINSTSNTFRFSGNNALSLVSLCSQNVVKINAAGYWGTQLVGANDQGILVNNTGNVGIGTISPCAKLHIQGTEALQDLLYFCTGGSVNTKFVYSIVSGADDAFVLRRSHTTQGELCIMSWTYNGLVGIGTTTPGQALSVSGNAYIGNLSNTLNFSQGGCDRFLEVGAGSGGDALLVAHSSGYGVGYFGYEASNDRLVIATDCGGGANKIDFILNAGTCTGGSGDNLNACPVMRITSGNLILACGRTSSIMASSGNIQEWVGLTGAINNNTGWSLFSITNQFDNLSMDIYVFTDVGSFQASKHEAVFGYTSSTYTGIGFSSAFCIFQTGTLYNETMTICNLSGSNIVSQRIAIRVWGYGVGQNGTGGSNLLNTSCLTRIK